MIVKWSLFFVLFLIIGIVIVASSHPDSHSQQITYKNEPNTDNSNTEPKMDKNGKQKANGGTDNQKCNNYWETYLVWTASHDKAITAISTMCIAAFTLVLFVATLLLWLSGERHAERQLRAYVNTSGAEIKFSENEAFVKLLIKNFGQTPAYKTKQGASVWVAELPLKSALPARTPGLLKSISTISPQDHHLIEIKHPITVDQKTALAEGTQAIYVYGDITYTDIFKKIRTTNFRFIYWSGSPSLPNKSFSLGVCDEGNDAN